MWKYRDKKSFDFYLSLMTDDNEIKNLTAITAVPQQPGKSAAKDNYTTTILLPVRLQSLVN